MTITNYYYYKLILFIVLKYAVCQLWPACIHIFFIDTKDIVVTVGPNYCPLAKNWVYELLRDFTELMYQIFIGY